MKLAAFLTLFQPRTALLAALFVAGCLRLINLDAPLWYDEILTLTQFVRLAPTELAVTYGSLNNHVLYTWLAKLSAAAFGETAFALRLPAALLGVVSIWATAALFRRTGWIWAAIVASALLAVSYHHVWFSQNARGYTGLLLFSTLAAIALARALNSRKAADWALYGLAFAAAMATHLSAFFLLAAQGVVALAVELQRAGRGEQKIMQALKGPSIGFGVGSLILLLLFAPMISGMMDAFSDAAGAAAPTQAEPGVKAWKNPLWTAFEAARSFGPVAALLPFVVAFIAIGGVRLARRAPLIAWPFILHVPLTLALLAALSFRIWPRYFFVDIGFMIFCAVIGAFWFADRVADFATSRTRLPVTGAHLKIMGSVCMIAFSTPLLLRNYAAPKQDFESAIAKIVNERAAGDAVLSAGLADAVVGGYYAPGWPSVSDAEALMRVEQASAGVWVITAFPDQFEARHADLDAALASRYRQVARFRGTLSGGDVIVWRRRAP